MTRAAFATLRFSKRLQATGMSEEQAVAQAEAMAEALRDFADTLVTKDYLKAVLEAELSDIRATQRLHSWMLGILVVTQLVPLLRGTLP
jgi:hypothetical protein